MKRWGRDFLLIACLTISLSQGEFLSSKHALDDGSLGDIVELQANDPGDGGIGRQTAVE
ncbi:hypothetical protein [Halobacillus sp. Marseille-P3879]|uniref:hypothetical protein n=1 Tax=Halobacillus sp. Marseille-P3879 TaxID=2045014 RepID=UPI00135C18A4|nr:hypothetical protein [Halobacillus sp. Marseille-P3879]